MKRFFLLLVAAMAVTACGTARRVSMDSQRSAWTGCSTEEILRAMGDPVRIDADGKDGSILVYESSPNYSSPDYDILDPDADARQNRRYAYFYLNGEGTCYRVDTNRNLPAPPNAFDVLDQGEFWIDILIYLPLLVVGILL